MKANTINYIIVYRKDVSEEFRPYISTDNWFKTTEEAVEFLMNITKIFPKFHFKMYKAQEVV